MIALAERLTEVMKELGLETPTQLATFCGVTQGLVTQWFDGSSKLGPKPLLAFARTHFDLDWIKQPQTYQPYQPYQHKQCPIGMYSC